MQNNNNNKTWTSFCVFNWKPKQPSIIFVKIKPSDIKLSWVESEVNMLSVTYHLSFSLVWLREGDRRIHTLKTFTF